MAERMDALLTKEQPILDVRNLKKYFPTKYGTLHAVDDVSFTLEKGKTLGIVGESGCGKSTIGRTILRLLEPTDGAVLFEGKNIFEMNRKELHVIRKEVQMIFQDPFSSLDPRISVADAIGEAFLIQNPGWGRQRRQAKVYEIMDMVGLVGYPLAEIKKAAYFLR
ncbi:MAG: ATP-binding cassette domain-containing protein [Bacillota bacterium]